MTKVVFNSCFGGFTISKKCAKRMAALGSADVALMLEEHIKDGDDYWYGGLYNHSRHCPILIQAVEELGDDASGDCAALRVAELEGDRYIIDEYDGREIVVEPDAICWIIV
jgi:hypothetical protein